MMKYGKPPSLQSDPGTHDEGLGADPPGAQNAADAYQRLVSVQDISLDIINSLLRTPRSAIDAAIHRALARTGEMALADRTYVFRVRNETRLDNTHEWVADGIEPMIHHLQNLPADMMNEWMPDFVRDRAVTIPDVDALPENSDIKQMLAMQGIRSLLAVPIISDGTVAGFVGYDAVRGHRSFVESETNLIRSVANVIGVVLERRDAEISAEAARDSLQTERNRLHATLTAIPDLILELDREGRFIGYHAGNQQGLAMPPEQFIGRRPEEVFSAELASLAHQAMADVDLNGVVATVEYSLVHQGASEERWYQLSAAPRQELKCQHGYVFAIRDITESRSQQKMLQRLSEVARRTSNLVVVTDRHDRIEWVNPAFEARSGWAQDEVKGRRPGDFLAAGHQDAGDRSRIRNALAAGSSVKAKLLNRSRDGEEYWISADIQPLVKNDKSLSGFIAVQTDITENIKNEEKLKISVLEANISRKILISAVEALDQGFAIFDDKDELVVANHAFLSLSEAKNLKQYVGVNFKSILGERIVKGVYGIDPDCRADWLSERLHLDPCQPRHFEDQLANGRWIRTVLVATSDGGRAVLESDITQIKEDQRRAIRDRALAMESSQDGIALTDPQGRYIFMNAAHRRVFGVGIDDDVSSLCWKDLYSPAMVAWIEETIVPRLLERRRWRGPIQAHRRDGSPIEQEVSLTLNEDGGMICITRDNTEQNRINRDRARLRDQLQVALREGAISHVLSDLAHDFKNIWAVAVGSLSLAQERVEATSPLQKDFDRIENSLQAANGLFKGITKQSQPNTTYKICELKEIISEAEQLLTFRLTPDQIVRIKTENAPSAFMADRSSIMQVILNLMTNARDAVGDAAAIITIEAQAVAGGCHPERMPDIGMVQRGRHYALIRISDTGPGVPTEIRARIFDRNFTTKGERGTGLGLSIVAAALRRNSAAMWFDSAPEAGTVATVLWPMNSPDTNPDGIEADSAGHGKLAGRRIMVVDDAADVARILADMLATEGAITTVVTNPLDAIAQINQATDHWDAVITDFDMPAMTGAALARQLRHMMPRLSILAVSAMAETIGDDIDAFDRILCKPVMKPALTEGVLKCLNNPRSDARDQTIFRRTDS